MKKGKSNQIHRSLIIGFAVVVFESSRCVAIFGLLASESGRMHVGLLLLSILGLYISSYFTLVYYGFIRAETKYIPAFCRMAEGSCMLVIHHPDARIFGVSNAPLGVVYYAFVFLFAVDVGADVLLAGLRLSSLVTVILAVYLIHSLFIKIRVRCILCLTSHGINMLIAILVFNH